jgi:amino acid adenylation domain-containing protein
VTAQAARTPDAVAVLHGDWHLTYGELERQANRLARHLQRLGVGREVVVDVVLERGLDLAVSVLAVLDAGGAYLPLDPGYPRERLAFMLDDAAAPVVLTHEHLLAGLGDYGGKAVCLDRDADEIAGQAESAVASGVASDGLAYVIYTSGSTGHPKGVLVPHRAVVNHATAMASWFGLEPDDRVLQLASPSFDVAAEEIFPTWSTGAAVVLWSHRITASYAELLRFIEEQGITVVNLSASWHGLTHELPALGDPLPASLRLVVVGSEKVRPDRLRAWQQRVGDRVRWLHAYGTSETTITSAVYEPPPALHPSDQAIPIGRPLPNTSAFVLDGSGQALPVGVSGRLHVGGRGLARGYLGQPELTARRFVPHPVDPSQRVYDTGDLARWRPDRTLELLGRADDQVKVRGARVEPGEVEVALRAHPAVGEAVVIAREDPPGRQCLVAYVVATAGRQPRQSELRRHLAARLPAVMVPSAVVVLDAFPLTPGGKLDRRGLPEPTDVFPGQPGLTGDLVAPVAPSRSWSGSCGARCWASRSSASTTNSSSSAVTPSLPPKSSPGSGSDSGWRCRCEPSSTRRRWRGSPPGSWRRRAARHRPTPDPGSPDVRPHRLRLRLRVQFAVVEHSASPMDELAGQETTEPSQLRPGAAAGDARVDALGWPWPRPGEGCCGRQRRRRRVARTRDVPSSRRRPGARTRRAPR